MISSQFDKFLKYLNCFFVSSSEIALSEKIQKSYLERVNPQTLANPKPLRGRVKRIEDIQNTVKDVIDYCNQQAKRKDLSDEDKQWIRETFEQLPKLGKTLFPRIPLEDSENLQRILSGDLDTLYSKEENDPSLKTTSDHLLEIALAKAKLSTTIGCATKIAGGCHRSVIIHDLEGHPVGVFKTPQSDLISVIVSFFKRLFGQERLFNRSDVMNESYSEVAMYYFSEVFGLHVAPAAKMTQLLGRDGAFIGFLNEFRELKDVKQAMDKESFSENELITWQMAMVAIFASWNFDPHACNIFVSMQDGKLDAVKVIDGGNNFPQYLPEWGSVGYRTYPGTLKISEQAFHPKVIEFIKKNLTISKLTEFFEKVDESPLGRNFMNLKMKNILFHGILVLQEKVVTEAIKTPKVLLEIITEKDLDRIASPGTIVDVDRSIVSRLFSPNE